MRSDTCLFAATGRRCINPPMGIAHQGWGAQRHERAEGIDLDLWTTALALSDQSSKVIILDLDLIFLSGEGANRLRSVISAATGVPAECIRCSWTHSHSSPVTDKTWVQKGYDLVPPWLEAVNDLSAQAACEALSNLQPVEVYAGRGECLININRRALTAEGRLICGKNREGSSDHEVLVVKLDGLNGKTVATLVNYACHPTVLGPPNRLVTPDYPEVVKRIVEDAVGGRCLFLLGAAGDQGPIQGYLDDLSVYKSLGAILGHEVAKVALSLSYIPAGETLREVLESGAPLGIYDEHFLKVSSLPLKVTTREILVPLRTDLPEATVVSGTLRSWQKTIEVARAHGDDQALREAIFMGRRSDILLRLIERLGTQTELAVETQFICTGDVALVSCNFEPFSKTGFEIKRHSPFPVTLFSGYSNGYLGYMATSEERRLGGYEVEASPFGEGAAEIFQRQVLVTLHELRSMSEESPIRST